MLKPDRRTRQLDPFDEESPCRGDLVQHVDADGLPNERWTKVLLLEASDRREGLYEILDSNRTRMIITQLTEDTWIQVLV